MYSKSVQISFSHLPEMGTEMLPGRYILFSIQYDGDN